MTETIELFNGRDLTGWEDHIDHWSNDLHDFTFEGLTFGHELLLQLLGNLSAGAHLTWTSDLDQRLSTSELTTTYSRMC